MKAFLRNIIGCEELSRLIFSLIEGVAEMKGRNQRPPIGLPEEPQSCWLSKSLGQRITNKAPTPAPALWVLASDFHVWEGGVKK